MLTERKAAFATSAVAVALTLLLGNWLIVSDPRTAAAIDERGELALSAIDTARRDALATIQEHALVETGRWQTRPDDWKELAVDEQGFKILEQRVRFARPFPRTPTVEVAISRLDAPSGVSSSTAEVTAEDFLLRLSVRDPGAVRGFDGIWIAQLSPDTVGR